MNMRELHSDQADGIRQPQKQKKAYPETWSEVTAWYKVSAVFWTPPSLSEHARQMQVSARTGLGRQGLQGTPFG